MDYISKISEIFNRLNQEMLKITSGEIQFFEDNTFKKAAYSDLIPFHLSQEPETFWNIMSQGGQYLYEEEFIEVLNAIEAVENSFEQNKDELTRMGEQEVLDWIDKNSEDFLYTMWVEFTRIRKSNS